MCRTLNNSNKYQLLHVLGGYDQQYIYLRIRLTNPKSVNTVQNCQLQYAEYLTYYNI